MMKRELLDRYDGFVTGDSYKAKIIRRIYSDYDGKNKWSTISSVTQWLKVVYDFASDPKLEIYYDNQKSINLITYITCIDIISQCITQLNRVFFSGKYSPFKGQRDIFPKEIFPDGLFIDKDDDDIFQEIRASFGIHSVELGRGKEKKCFSGWTKCSNNCKSFSVSWYSSIPQELPFRVTIFKSQLELYC